MIVLAGVAVAINRAIVHALRTRREGLPRVVLAGDESDLDLARAHLAANVSELVVVAEVDDPARWSRWPRTRGPATCCS